MTEPTVDLYAILGVHETSTKAEIRKAYRKLAKTAHPDSGGDPAVFARISLAHDVLTDEARRARYDATGGYDEGTPDNGHVAMYASIALLLDQVAQRVVHSGKDIDTVDYVHEMRVAVRVEIETIGQAIAKVKKDLPKLQRAQKRISKRSAGPNVIAEIFASRIVKLEEFITTLTAQQAQARAMLEFLQDYDFDLSDLQRSAGNNYVLSPAGLITASTA